MATTSSNDPLVWIDCEMTGLDPEKDSILSIACYITDAQLSLLDTHGWSAVIHHSASTLDRMDEWCTTTHARSGLTSACLSSTTTAQQAADGLLAYIQQHIPQPRSGLLAGNSVHCDKEFLRRGPYRPILSHLTYRILDVSAIKEAARRWAPEEVLTQVPRKKGLHQAREDILESIEEARFYRNVFFARSDDNT